MLQLSLLRYDDDGQLDQSSIIPLIDGGTEGRDCSPVCVCHVLEPLDLNNGRTGGGGVKEKFVQCREVIPFSEIANVLKYIQSAGVEILQRLAVHISECPFSEASL